MSRLKEQIFVCIDCESTGLDPKKDQIVEIACATFTFQGVIDQCESLINPGCVIPQEVIAVHHITDDMVANQPKIDTVLPQILKIIGKHPIIGHGIQFDIDLIVNHAKRCGIACDIDKNESVDTLRLARLYGESPTNSLEQLRKHFAIEEEGAHRAMNDVLVNIQVFKKLTFGFDSLKEIKQRLSKPIQLKNMPLGKHKGRAMKELPLPYLLWAARQDFDQDLLFSLRTEVNRRKGGNQFTQAANPFSQLDL